MKISGQVLLLYFFAICCAANTATAQQGDWTDKVHPRVLKALDRHERTDCLILMKEQAGLPDAGRYLTKAARGAYVLGRLKETAARTQARVVVLLGATPFYHRPFYIVNMVHAEVDAPSLKELALLPEVQSVIPNPVIRQELPPAQAHATARGIEEAEWGVKRIGAPEVWALGFAGQGVVIGGQDTGYDWDHPALLSSYRGWENGRVDHRYNWHDAIHAPVDTANYENPCGFALREPCDDNSHGTHTMGTMAGLEGENVIGVAPQARWIGCRNMDRGAGTPATYLECFEWFLAPYDLNGKEPDPALAPDVINNSWRCPPSEGCVPGNFFVLEAAVDNLRKAGVVVVASAGNNGKACGSIDSPPAIFGSAFTVGATAEDEKATGWSSRGPVFSDGSGRTKPDVVAPGVGTRSAIPGGAYGVKSGTSMAGPHVAGVVALILSANPSLAGQVDSIEHILRQSAIPRMADQDCGDLAGAAVPNAVYGYGRVDALKAVQLATASGQPANPYGAPVYPNPFFNALTINTAGFSGMVDLFIYSSAGQLVYRLRWPAAEAPIQHIRLRYLPAGFYMYRLQGQEGSKTGKLVKPQ